MMHGNAPSGSESSRLVAFGPHTKATLTLANLFTSCFGGSSTPWSRAFGVRYPICDFAPNTGGFVSNLYNGTSPNDIGANGVPLNPYFTQSYAPSFSA